MVYPTATHMGLRALNPYSEALYLLSLRRREAEIINMNPYGRGTVKMTLDSYEPGIQLVNDNYSYTWVI